MKRPLLTTAVLIALAACGQNAPLKPALDKPLPVAPWGREDQPGAEELLKLPPQAAPERSVELRKRSEERNQDPFDLPPSSE